MLALEAERTDCTFALLCVLEFDGVICVRRSTRLCSNVTFMRYFALQIQYTGDDGSAFIFPSMYGTGPCRVGPKHTARTFVSLCVLERDAVIYWRSMQHEVVISLSLCAVQINYDADDDSALIFDR